MSDPIFALATPMGRAGVAVLRLSGDGAHAIAQRLVDGPALPKDGRSLRDIRDGERLIDQSLILTFDKGASFTGEEVVEFQTHGSLAVVNALLSVLGKYARPAEAGEFTRRALMNGELDLAQVEGLADLIEAETEAQLDQANHAFSGAMAAKVDQWRKDLIRAASLIEATIDFADEEVPQDVGPEVGALIAKTSDALRAEIAGSFAAERIRDGFEVAIVGPPNIGKSTLLNALAGREAAITSDIAGTTRDVIEVRMNIGGLPVTLLDTAGLRETDDQIEALGVDLAKRRADGADLRLFLTKDGKPDLTPREGDIVAIGKADSGSADGFGLSGKTGEGVDALLVQIADVLGQRASKAQTASHARHRIAMERAIAALDQASATANDPARSELAAAELRDGLYALSSLIGAVGVEDLLDEIFLSFCIGK